MKEGKKVYRHRLSVCYMKNRNIRPVKTDDGSYTLYFEELNEHYHSKDGAIGESRHVYIQNGLGRVREDESTIRVLEIGVGTGLNVILSLEWAGENSRQVEYTGLEPFPIDENTHRFLKENTPLFEKYGELYDSITGSQENTRRKWSDYFSYRCFHQKIAAFNSTNFKNYFDVIYFDAFAPSKQNEMWEAPVLQKCAEMLKDNGILTSYCASGQFKRSMKSAGFEIIREKGFALKREMFVGIKKPGL